MAERTSERLVRLLGIITYLDAGGERPRVAIADLAAHFGVTVEQVVKDLDLLWVSGTPGHWTDDLIDFDLDYEAGTVALVQPQGMTTPLRLGTREAVALIAALRAMKETLDDTIDPRLGAEVEGTLAVLTAATGEAAAALDVRLAERGSPAVTAALGAALTSGRRLLIRYASVADVVTERIVDPIRLQVEDEHSYLVAWCTRADDERSFRTDRILKATVLDEPAEQHVGVKDAPFRPADVAGPTHHVRLVLASPARWIAEQIPVEAVTDLDDGNFAVDLVVAEPAWLRQLLLQNARHVRSIEPAWVADDVAAAARDALACYT